MSETSEKSKFSPKSIARDHDSTNESGVLGKSLPAVALQFSLGDQSATMEESEKKSPISVNYQSAGGSSAPPPSSLNHIGNSSNSGSNSSVQLKASYPSVPAVQFKTSLSQIKGIEAPAFQFKAEQPIQRKSEEVVQKKEEDPWYKTAWNVATNDLLGGAVGAAADYEFGGNMASRLARGFSSLSGAETTGTMGRIADGTASTVESARRMQQLETGANARMGLSGGASTLGKLLAPLSVISGGLNIAGGISGISDNVNGTRGKDSKSGLEHMFDIATGSAGMISGGIGTLSALGVGGTSLAAGAGAAAPVLSVPVVGQVLGAFAAGAAAGTLLDSGADWVGDKITGNEGGDHSISGGLASGATSIDQSIARARGFDENEAYRHTAGWWLAENLPQWMQ